MVGDSDIFGWWRPTRGEPWGRARCSVDSQPARLVYRAGVTCLSFSFYQIAKQQFRPPSVTKTGKNLTDGLVSDSKTTVQTTVSHKNGQKLDWRSWKGFNNYHRVQYLWQNNRDLGFYVETECVQVTKLRWYAKIISRLIGGRHDAGKSARIFASWMGRGYCSVVFKTIGSWIVSSAAGVGMSRKVF